MTDVTSKQKDAVKTVLTCLKQAGVDLSKGKTKVKMKPNQAEMTIIINGEEEAIDIDFETGQVEYEYFTTKKDLGNLENKENLVQSIKSAFFSENDIKPNLDEGKINILKEQIKKYIRKYLEEMSGTGGGAAPGAGASFSPGAGENFATPKAFVGGSAKNPKKKKYLVSKKLTW